MWLDGFRNCFTYWWFWDNKKWDYPGYQIVTVISLSNIISSLETKTPKEVLMLLHIQYSYHGLKQMLTTKGTHCSFIIVQDNFIFPFKLLTFWKTKNKERVPDQYQNAIKIKLTPKKWTITMHWPDNTLLLFISRLNAII